MSEVAVRNENSLGHGNLVDELRRFVLQRTTDVSGVSGTGLVAEGVEFTDGHVALRWKGKRRSTTIHEGGIDNVEAIHGHSGSTKVVWLD